MKCTSIPRHLHSAGRACHDPGPCDRKSRLPKAFERRPARLAVDRYGLRAGRSNADSVSELAVPDEKRNRVPAAVSLNAS